MKHSLAACLLVFLTLAISGSGLPALGHAHAEVEVDINDIKPQPVITNKSDGSKVLAELTARIKKLGAYKFEGYLATRKDSSVKVDCGDFFFKPEACIRVEVKGHNYKSGSVLVKLANGTIRARGGPSLLGMKVNLEPDSNMLMLANGLNILECDYSSLLNWLQKQIAAGEKVYASEGPIIVQPGTDRVLVIEAFEPGSASALAHRIQIDPQQFVPVQWDIFKKGTFFSTVRFRNFQTCPVIDESLFHI